MTTLLHIDASGRQTDSASRQLSKQILNKYTDANSQIIYRDVSQGLPYVNETMINAYYTDPTERSNQQNASIAISNAIVEELISSDVIIIGVPIYNFSMPAGFKAWADLAARVGETFSYKKGGPTGLLENKKAYVVIASGGTKIDSDIDFLTPWLRQFFKFIGITDVEIIHADVLNSNTEQVMQHAESAIAAL